MVSITPPFFIRGSAKCAIRMNDQHDTSTVFRKASRSTSITPAGSGDRNDAEIVGCPGRTERYPCNDDQSIPGAGELLPLCELGRARDHLLVSLHMFRKRAVCTPQEAETTGHFHARRGGQ